MSETFQPETADDGISLFVPEGKQVFQNSVRGFATNSEATPPSAKELKKLKNRLEKQA